MALGLAKKSVIIYDMEAYDTSDATCRNGVLAFMNGWTQRLHLLLGYLSGYYSSVSSGIADQVAHYNVNGYARPDYVDFAPPPAATMADFNNNGWSDLIAKNQSTGYVYLYPGNGATIGPRSSLRTTWKSMTAVIRVGDLTKDGYPDLVARQNSTGTLYLFPGRNGSFGTKKSLGKGWNGVRDVVGVGDFDRDGYTDLIAAGKSDNALLLWRGNGTALLASRTLTSSVKGLTPLG